MIGAKRSDEMEIVATVAHELTHYAMHLVYQNLVKPYYHSDGRTMADFDEIVSSYNNGAML